MTIANLTLPGNPRYQPKELKNFFGYDRLYGGVAQVEIATLEVLGEIGVIPLADMETLTREIAEALIAIPTTEVDSVERKITKHDIRAWVRKAQEIVWSALARWMHVPLTSFDSLDTGRSWQFLSAYRHAIRPSIAKVVEHFSIMIEKFAKFLQIGRTHGQHALPITVGFWMATVQNRVVENWQNIDYYANHLVGKISGAVGAYNAQVGLKFNELCLAKTGKTFEERVLEKLGLYPARISTQILPPEPLAYFLFSCTMLSASLAQFGRDCRHLMRSEIGEISESFEEEQVGSSTMAHKRNPINFENLEGMFIRTKNEFGKVLDTLISEHQRDLAGSSVARDFPIILVNLQTQLNTLLKTNDAGVPFLRRISVNQDACRKNFDQSAHLILAEPLYIALQMAGYQGDAHELVNHKLVPIATRDRKLLAEVLCQEAETDPELMQVVKNIPDDLMDLLHKPESYTGLAGEKAIEIARYARRVSAKIMKG